MRHAIDTRKPRSKGQFVSFRDRMQSKKFSMCAMGGAVVVPTFSTPSGRFTFCGAYRICWPLEMVPLACDGEKRASTQTVVLEWLAGKRGFQPPLRLILYLRAV